MQKAHDSFRRIPRPQSGQGYAIIELNGSPIIGGKALIQRGVIDIGFANHPSGKDQVGVTGFASSRLFGFFGGKGHDRKKGEIRRVKEEFAFGLSG
jgi:hypothetical protein